MIELPNRDGRALTTPVSFAWWRQ